VELDSPIAIGRKINSTNLTKGKGGIDNFIEAGKALRGEPLQRCRKVMCLPMRGWHQTVESILPGVDD